ncbi:hypothetical protein C7212DRAFT_296133 [Tuber magnatum]|uniref:Uncharacterized protein n=1 Tax=Tuber magnatum TaxID=42249 RepID=A0A317ST52_9PEZI|nr:hypothetical protein C7212DRAFT_296133 [Tuber magnatum]
MALRVCFRITIHSRRLLSRGTVTARGFASCPLLLRLNEPLPRFKPTARPELGERLAKFRQELVLPFHLSSEHKKIIRRECNHAKLLNEPLFVEIAGEKVQLLPNTHGQGSLSAHGITNMISAMNDPNEIDNILPFLLGLRQAEIPLKEGHKQKIIRACNLMGRVDLTIRIVKNVRRYNFHLTKPIARECMRSTLVEQAVPDKDLSRKAVRHANLFMKLFVNTAIKVDPAERLKRDPVVIGTALGVFADNDLRYNDKVDSEGETEKLCRLLKDQCWDQVEWECPAPTERKQPIANRKKHVHNLLKAILDYTPVLEGLLVAKDILVGVGDLYPWLSGQSEKLAERIAEWKQHVASEKDILSDSPRLSIDSYRAAAELIQQREEKEKAGELFEEASEEGADEESVEVEEAVDDDGLNESQRQELEELEKGM